MRVILEVMDGTAAGKVVSIEASQACRVGRGDAADLVIADDGLLSRMHFVVECDGASCRLRDLNSTNGTYVNGQRVSEAEVGEADRVLAGTTSFALHALVEETAPPVSGIVVPGEASAGGKIGKETVLAMKPYNPPEPNEEQ